jgi:hypothetical protein
MQLRMGLESAWVRLQLIAMISGVFKAVQRVYFDKIAVTSRRAI